MTSIPCDIVLIPSPSISKLAYEVSSAQQPLETFFTLRDGEYFPHLSLYMIQFDLTHISILQETLNRIARTVSPIALQAKEYHLDGGYYDVEYLRGPTIDNLQMQVVDAVNPLRDGLRKKDMERIKTATGIELTNLETYGYRSIGQEFAPHLTLTRFKDVDTQPIQSITHTNFDGDFTKIGVFEMGENGTCVREIYSVRLG